MKVRERIKRLETKLSQDAESQASRRHLREELTEFLHALRAWARQNQFAQTPDDAGASETKISPEVESQGFHQLLQQAITEYLEALRAWARHNQQPQAVIDTKASKPEASA
jgi:hypothetical protein